LVVVFTNLSTGNVISATWNFGDGATLTTMNKGVSHTYITPGTYTVTLTVGDGAQTSTAVRPSYIVVSPLVGVRYVATSGSDTGNTCLNSASPCATIQHAVDVAVTGNEVRVATGTYTGVSPRARNDVAVIAPQPKDYLSKRMTDQGAVKTIAAPIYRHITTGTVIQVVYINKSVTIRGGYTTSDWLFPDPIAHPTIVDAQGQGRVIYVTGSITPTVENLRLTGGNAAGLGGISGAYDDGGGVYVISATLSMKNNQVYGNTADRGGGVHVMYSPAALINNAIFANTAGGGGGGVYVDYSDSALLSGNTITNNIANFSGGGVFMDNSDAALTAGTVYSNTASDGGGVYLTDSSATLSSTVLLTNTAQTSGGGVLIDARSDATLLRSVVYGNSSAVSGGGVFCNFNQSKLLNNLIQNNSASVEGGGVSFHNECDATLDGDLVRSNSSASGGGVYLEISDAIITNTAIVDNQASSTASGLYVRGSSPDVWHATIARNGGGDGSGVVVSEFTFGFNTFFSAAILTNTIVSNEAVGVKVTGFNNAVLNGVVWFGNTANTSGAVAIFNAFTGDPVFTSDGYHINAGSAAIDRAVATSVAIDIDGQARPQGSAKDIGVDEYATRLLGRVVNTLDAQPIAGASVCLTSSGECATTDAQGNYVIDSVLVGGQSVRASASGFYSLTQIATLQVQQPATLNFALSPVLAAGEMRVVLTWGANPRDLDAHLWLPGARASHINWARPGNCTVFPRACLEVDQRFSFGPETITIKQRFTGTYIYAAYLYAGNGSLTTSGARVQIYDSSGLLNNFDVPIVGTGRWWYVFDLDGVSGTVTPHNVIQSTSPGPYDSTSGECSLTAAQCP
jgi:PKD repeat protein